METSTCPFCGGNAHALGVISSMARYRCRQCGQQHGEPGRNMDLRTMYECPTSDDLFDVNDVVDVKATTGASRRIANDRSNRRVR